MPPGYRWCTACGHLWHPDVEATKIPPMGVGRHIEIRPCCECPGDYARTFPLHVREAAYAAYKMGGADARDALLFMEEQRLFNARKKNR